MGAAFMGTRLAGIRVQTVGLDRLDPNRTYVFMSNHVSNIDPPIMLPLIPRRTSVMAKKELFDYPLLGKTMRLGSLVPVDRGNRDAGISAVRAAAAVLRQGINMTIYVEGHRSFDGKLAAFQERAVLSGDGVWRAGRASDHLRFALRHAQRHGSAIKPGTVTMNFHPPIEPEDFGSREAVDGESQASDR